MKKIILVLLMTTTIVTFGQKQKKFTFKYPITEKVPVIDDYFGTKITDNYRWLEDDKSVETAEWVKKQNELTDGYLDQIPYREAMRARMANLWNYERISAPFKEGNFIYFYKNDGLQNQSVLYRKVEGGDPEVFLDPNTFSKDGTSSLGGINFSKDGSKVAYAISEGGSDWRKVIIMDAVSKKILEDPIVDVKFSGVSWFGNEGFYYSSYDKPKGSELSAKTDQHKLYYHKLGTKQKIDKLIFGLEQKRRYVTGYVSEDNNYLFISAANSTSGNELYYLDLKPKKDKKTKKLTKPGIKPIILGYENDVQVIDNVGTKLYIETNHKAPNVRVVTVDVANPSPENWQDFIPESENVLNASTGGGFVFANYMKDALSLIKQYDYSSKLVREIALPGIGSAGGLGGKKEDKILYYSFTNYTTPATIYAYDAEAGLSKVYQKPKLDFDGDNYESKQVFYTSKDGTKVPMIITHKKGLKLDGKNPTILLGYGGFNVSLTPSFGIANVVWLENGGVYAVPNLRGGGEYGKKWHDAGTKMQKQNVFDDFIAAAEYLIAQKYTSSSFLAIRGGSNGGLLVGATMTQRPDLMKVALPAVGVLDMLRYHTFTAGAGWAYDYGTAEDSDEMFKYIYGYSPLHNIKAKTKYPATMVTTGDHDDRVVPAHSFKFAAELQAKQEGKNPTLIRIAVNAGHGAGKSVAETIQESVDVFCFTFFNMGIKKLPALKK